MNKIEQRQDEFFSMNHGNPDFQESHRGSQSEAFKNSAKIMELYEFIVSGYPPTNELVERYVQST